MSYHANREKKTLMKTIPNIISASLFPGYLD